MYKPRETFYVWNNCELDWLCNLVLSSRLSVFYASTTLKQDLLKIATWRKKEMAAFAAVNVLEFLTLGPARANDCFYLPSSFEQARSQPDILGGQIFFSLL